MVSSIGNPESVIDLICLNNFQSETKIKPWNECWNGCLSSSEVVWVKVPKTVTAL